jgi:hypothetical protein
MKRSFIISLSFLILILTVHSVTYAQTAENDQSTATSDEQQITAEIDNVYWWESYCQTIGVDSTHFYGMSQNILYSKDAVGIHLRPTWQWRRFEGSFDLAFYQNPWDDNHWQWGIPLPGMKPIIPNFIDSISYQGDWLNINYQKVRDLNFGYGLLINDYHPTNPYHGWIVNLTPTDTTQLTFASSQEIIDLSPFERNDYASLQVLRLDQSLDAGGLRWQLGSTEVHEDYSGIDKTRFPVGGTEYDLILTNVIWCSPFWEMADLDNLGGANMLGVKGKLGLVSYQTGVFRTHGKFVPNYFGGRYEDLKWNSWANSGIQGLPIVNSSDDDSHDGLISQLWVAVSPWLNLGCLNIADTQNTTGVSFAGKIERLGVEYGLFYYNQLQNVYNYDWFIRGGNGFIGYEYHYYYDWDRNCYNEFELSFKF